MFSRHHGSDFVKTGTYLCLYSGEFVDVPGPGGPLPGSPRTLYLAVSPIVALLVGPIAGLAFVIFLPLAVPLLIVWLVARRLRRRASDALKPLTVQTAYATNPAAGPTHSAAASPMIGQGPERQPLDKLLADIDKLLADMEGRPDDKHPGQ